MDNQITSFLKRNGGDVEVLDLVATHRLHRRWLDEYAKPVKDATGDWIYNNCMWHAFSWNFVPAKCSNDALVLYSLEEEEDLLILPELDDDETAVRVRGLKSPDLSSLFRDVHVTPDSFEWTMAFTHEQPEIGPFFSRRAWVQAGRPLQK